MTSDSPVVLLAYDGVAADEAGALVEILTRSGIEVIIASVESHPITSYHGRVVPECSAADLGDCGALVIPGGMGVRAAAENPELLSAIRRLAMSAAWLGATSTGSILLTAAGLARRSRVTTHWLAGDMITERGVELVDRPFVEHGRLLTASGLASTATLSFRLVGALSGTGAEREARARYQPGSAPDTRSGRRRPWWRTLGRKQVVTVRHHVDPNGAADLVILHLEPD